MNRIMDQGVIVGCDLHQQWMLPWWWRHYSTHNSYPVVFMDFGMSEEARSWCKKRGECLSLSNFYPVSSEKIISPSTKALWERRYGKGFWIRRQAWFKKPFSLLQCPFSVGIWIDIDCQVNCDLEALFQCIHLGAEIGICKDRNEIIDFILPGEIHYSSGVIAFRKDSPILQQWVDLSIQEEQNLPGDEETLSRAIFTFRPNLVELPPTYNWCWSHSPNENVIIRHFSGGQGKIELLNHFTPQDPTESLLLLQSLKSL